jgi:hypothetical protein
MIAFNSGFGRVGGVVVDNVPEDGLDYAIHESFVEFEQLRSKTAIAFANVYEADMLDSTKDSAEKEAIFEGLVGDIFEKIKNFFKELGQKIKSWFMNVKRFFESYFMNNKKFVEKYRNELTSKDLSKFSYDGGHEWKFGEIKKFEAAAGKALAVVENREKAMLKYAKEDKFNKQEDNSGWDDNKVKETIDRVVGYKGTAKMNEAIDKAVRGKEKTLKNINIQDTIDNVVEMKDRLSSIQDNIEKMDDLCEKAVAAIDKFKDEANDAKAETDDAKSKKSTATTLASRVAGWYKYIFGYMNAVATREHALTKECAGESMSICRAVLSYKPANESWSATRESSTASILDSYGY